MAVRDSPSPRSYQPPGGDAEREAALRAVTLEQLIALPVRFREYQARAVEHSQQRLQLRILDNPRWKLAFESRFDLLHAHFAVEHLQDEVFFLGQA